MICWMETLLLSRVSQSWHLCCDEQHEGTVEQEVSSEIDPWRRQVLQEVGEA